MASDLYVKSSEQTHVTALSAAEWTALSAKRRDDEYVVVTAIEGDGLATKAWPYAPAMRIFNTLLDELGPVYAPDTVVSMRVMSVSEWTRVGAR